MSNNRSKYRRNRQLWRKVYGPRRRKPDTTTFVDPVTSASVTFDLHRTVRHRDYFIIRAHGEITSSIIIPDIPIAEYDEGLVSFSGTDSASTGFSFCFSGTPDAVVLTVDPTGDNSDYIIPYGLTFNSCSMSIGLSAPFTGDIRYRAVYSSEGYPAYASSSLTPSSGTFLLSAGSVTPAGTTNYTATYPNVGGTPSVFYKTAWDFSSNNDVDVFISEENSTATATSGEISAPLSNPIYFIAVE